MLTFFLITPDGKDGIHVAIDPLLWIRLQNQYLSIHSLEIFYTAFKGLIMQYIGISAE